MNESWAYRAPDDIHGDLFVYLLAKEGVFATEHVITAFDFLRKSELEHYDLLSYALHFTTKTETIETFAGLIRDMCSKIMSYIASKHYRAV